MSVEEEMVESEEVIEEIESEESEEDIELDEPSESEESTEGEEESEDDDEEDYITLGDEEAPASEEEKNAPEWVKKVRKTNREIQRENRELKQKLEQLTTTETKPVQLSKKPTLEDHDYDSDKYEESLTEWFEQKRKHDELQAKAEQEKQQQAEAWNKTLETYAQKKSSLKVSDYDEAEYTVLETLSETQQGIILQGADDPALLVYALGKNPKRAKELADIKDPVKFSFAVSKLETTVKKNSRKKAPPAEKTVSGTGKSSVNDSTLDRLRAEAEKTGNYSKVTAYKAKMKNKG